MSLLVSGVAHILSLTEVHYCHLKHDSEYCFKSFHFPICIGILGGEVYRAVLHGRNNHISLGDSQTGLNAINKHPVLGDTQSIVSAIFYAVYITLIRKHLPDDDGKGGKVSMAQFLGFLGFFNMVIFFPGAFVLNFTKLEPFYILSWKQLGLVIGKGLLDNVLSDYLWAKAVLLTTTTVATAGLTIQVPLAAVVDTLTGNAPQPTDLIGAAAIMIGFTGISLPSDTFSRSTSAG
ncbi:Solute carrier family 35 member F5-like protein [Drosera capensis]